MIVDVETNHVRFPLNREKMKVVGKALIICKWVGCANAVPAGISGTVDRAVDDRGFLADILPDVDLAAVGPARFVDIGAEHPEGGPDSLSTRYLTARLESPIGLRKLARGFQASGSVVSGDAVRARVFFPQYLDDEVAILH